MREQQHLFQSKRKRTWLFWLAPSAAILATLFFLEIGLRVVAISTDKVRGATFDSELGWRLIAGITKADHQWNDVLPATTNSAGWRDAEYSLEKPEGLTRILVLGDSFAFGFGVDYGQRFSEYLEEISVPLEVLNMGVFAYSTDQQLRVYELHGKQTKPDIVILNVYLGNDIEDLRLEKVFGFPKPYFILEGDQLNLVKPEQSWPMYLRMHSYLVELVFQVLEGGTNPSAVADELRDRDMDALFFSLIAKLDDATSSEDTKLLVVLHHPRDATEEENSHYANIVRELVAHDRDVLDLYGIFAGRTKSEDGFYLTDGHLNPAGHWLVAEAMRKDLIAREWIAE